jgi:hypothetical protein
VIFAVVAPAGTVAWMAVSLRIVNEAIFVPNFTPLTIPKPAPVIATVEPTAPCAGVNDDSTGNTEKTLLVAVPSGLTTDTLPVVTPAGTVASIVASSTSRKEATALPNFTCVVPLKPLPEIDTVSPAKPWVTDRDTIAGSTPNGPELVAEPSGAVTVSGPEVAPTGTTALTLLALT